MATLARGALLDPTPLLQNKASQPTSLRRYLPPAQNGGLGGLDPHDLADRVSASGRQGRASIHPAGEYRRRGGAARMCLDAPGSAGEYRRGGGCQGSPLYRAWSCGRSSSKSADEYRRGAGAIPPPAERRASAVAPHVGFSSPQLGARWSHSRAFSSHRPRPSSTSGSLPIDVTCSPTGICEQSGFLYRTHRLQPAAVPLILVLFSDFLSVCFLVQVVLRGAGMARGVCISA
jgi:hypothetical protein